MKTKEDLAKEIEEAEEAERLAALEDDNELDVNSDDDGEADEDTGDGDDSGADEDGEGDKKSVPSFMTDEEDDADDDGAAKEQEGTIRAIAKQREKKRLAEEKADKLEQENELLRKQLATGASTQELGPRPKIDDFDSDADYDTAVDAWHSQKATAGAPAAQAASDQAQEHQRTIKRINNSYDAHLDRTEVLAKEHNIEPKVYQEAEESLMDIIDGSGVLPKGVTSELYMKNMIDVVGEGSEKVILNLLMNKKAKKEFEAIIATDKHGLKVAGWLSAKAYELRGTETKKRSNARKPATQINGNASGGKSSKALQKKFDSMKEKDLDGAIELRRVAKASGVDVSKWV